MRQIMLETLERGMSIVRDGHEIIPTWHVMSGPETFVLMTRFDPDAPGQRDRMIYLASRFMVWKMATAFVLSAEMSLGARDTKPEDFVLAVGVSRTERVGVMRRIRRKKTVTFGKAEWLGEKSLDPMYFEMLPKGTEVLTAEEVAELGAVFGDGGEVPVTRM